MLSEASSWYLSEIVLGRYGDGDQSYGAKQPRLHRPGIRLPWIARPQNPSDAARRSQRPPALRCPLSEVIGRGTRIPFRVLGPHSVDPFGWLGGGRSPSPPPTSPRHQRPPTRGPLSCQDPKGGRQARELLCVPLGRNDQATRLGVGRRVSGLVIPLSRSPKTDSAGEKETALVSAVNDPPYVSSCSPQNR